MNKYSPIRIVNPLSDHHLVKVKTSQELMVHLTNSITCCELDIVSDFLEIADKRKLHDRIIYRIVQKKDFTDWAQFSKIHLGDITVLYEKKGKNEVPDDYECSTISVILEGTTNNVLTVINPKISQIRVIPDQMLEVVVYDATSFEDRDWKYDIKKSGAGIEFAYLEISDPQYDTKVTRRTDDPVCREYHFWFKFSDETQGIIQTLEAGNHSAGTIEFFYQRNEEKLMKYEVELFVKVKNGKNKKILVPSQSVPNRSLSRHEDNSYWIDERREYDEYIGLNRNNRSNVPDEPTPNRKSVALIEKNNPKLDSDCKFMYMKW